MLPVSSDSTNYFLSARANEMLGHYNYIKSYKSEAIRYLSKADSLYGLAGEYEHRIYNLNMLGTIYQLSNNLTDGLITLIRADRMLGEQLPNDSTMHIDLHIDIGLIFFKLGRFEKATRYYTDLLSYRLSKEQEAQVLNNLAIIAIRESDYSLAIDYLKGAEKLYLTVGDAHDLARIYNNLGSALEKSDYDEDTIAGCYERSVFLKKSLADSSGIVSPLINLASYYLRMQQFDKTKFHINRLNRLQEYFDVQDFATFYFIQAAILQNEGKFKEALEQYKLFYVYTDSLTQIERNWQLTKAESEVEIEKKENEIKLLQKEHDLTEIRTVQQRYTILAISVVSFALILILLVVARFYYNKQRLEQRIRNRDVKLASVSNLVKGQEEERLRIAKDLHDGVGNNLAMVKAEIIKNSTGENKDYLAQLVTQTSEEVRNITHDLMPVVIRKFGLVEGLNDLIEKWKHTDQVFIDINYENHPQIDKNASLTIYRIVQELIKNSITHGEANYIIIIISQNKDGLTLIYEDNGSGMLLDETDINIGSGIQNINNRVSYLNGTMYTNSETSGLKYTFVFKDLKYENTNS
jgi:signal transduction histidine kinase